jgi:hypothetical protein
VFLAHSIVEALGDFQALGDLVVRDGRNGKREVASSALQLEASLRSHPRVTGIGDEVPTRFSLPQNLGGQFFQCFSLFHLCLLLRLWN